jgi:hypothetical protein
VEDFTFLVEGDNEMLVRRQSSLEFFLDISPQATGEDLDDDFVCLKIKKFDRNSKKRKKLNMV